MSSLRDLLIAAAAESGGWGYHAGRSSRIEPTCWALLALSDDRPPALELEPHWRFLARCQRPSGLLVESPELPPNLAFNGLAALTLQHRSGAVGAAVPALLAALVRHAGLQVPQSPNFRQDNSLRGWPWIDGTFSWTEPTAWILLALKRARKAGLALEGTDARVAEAERMLFDRCCEGGGWNYGNANALGKALYPYISTTALALLALRDQPNEPAVAKSLRYLDQRWPTESSSVSLALTAICLRSYGAPAQRVTAALAARQDIALKLGNLHAVAAAVAAGSSASHDAAFAV